MLLGNLRVVLSEPRLDPPDVGSVRTSYGVKERPNVEEQTFVLNPIVPPDRTLVVGPLADPWGKRRNLWILMDCAVEPIEKK